MRRVALALMPLLLFGCTAQDPAAPASEQTHSSTTANTWMNNPDVGNFKVFRSEGDLAACWTDPTNGLRACHATIPLGGGTEPDCGLQAPANGVAWQQLLIDEEAFRVIANAMGTVWITVRDLNNGGICFNNALIAEGWGTMHYTDNDQFFSGLNANAWGFSAAGSLTSPAGVTVGYTGHARFTISPGPNGTFFDRATTFAVNLR